MVAVRLFPCKQPIPSNVRIVLKAYAFANYVPDLPGCISTGKTLKEVEINKLMLMLLDSIATNPEYLQSLREALQTRTEISD
jgi:hypothetical protein